MDGNFYHPISAIRAGLTCKCPRCGDAKLDDGYLSVAEHCPRCDLDFAGVALLVEVAFQPPYWLHMLLWLPSVLFGALAMPRPCKATLVALRFKSRQDLDVE